MAQQQQHLEARAVTSITPSSSSSSSFKAIVATSGRPSTTAIGGGGGPMRAMRCYGLKPSPSTPLLPTALMATSSLSPSDGTANLRRWLPASSLQAGESVTSSSLIAMSGTQELSASGWWPVMRSATVPAGSSAGLVRGIIYLPTFIHT